MASHRDSGLGWPTEQPLLLGTSIVLRPWRSSDAAAVFEACQDPAIQRWTTVPSPYQLDHATGFVTQLAPSQWSDERGAAFCVASQHDEVLGSCGLVAIDPTNRVGEVGYWTVPHARGRGITAMALERLASWAFTSAGLDRLELLIDPENVASTRVAEQVGCRLEGLMYGKALVRGVRRDVVLYAMVKQD